MLFADPGAMIPALLLIVGTIACVALYWRRQYLGAIGVLFVVASFSRFAVDVAGANMRLEQPSIAVIALMIIVRERARLLHLIRAAWLPIVLVVTYLAAHLLSSAMVAPEPMESLRIAAWLVVSAVAGGIAALVAFRQPAEALPALARWIIVAAAIQTGVAVIAVASQVIFDTEWGVQSTDVLIGKAYGLSYEANIFGILLATALPLVLVGGAHVPAVRRPARYALVAWLAIGLGLSYSRGPLIAFGLAIGALLAVRLVHPGPWRARMRRFAPIAMHAGVAMVLAVGAIQVQDAFARLGARDTEGIVVVGEVPAPAPSARQTPGAGATPSPSEPVRYVGTSDTIGLRLRNSMRALADVPQSPLIGLGTDSYGQRHTEPGCRCPAHVSNLTVATLYESGVVGSVALVGLFAVAGIALWRLRAWAFATSLLAMIVGYQATDAFRFATSWVVMGTIIGVWAATSRAAGAHRMPSAVRE